MNDQYTRNQQVGQLIRKFRVEMKLKQNELAKQIDIHPSVMSRLERGELPLTHQNLEKLTFGFQLAGLLKEKIDHLWEIAGYHQTPIFDTPVSSKIVPAIHKELESLQEKSPLEKIWLEDELQEIININRAYRTAKKYIENRKWPTALEELKKLRMLIDKKNQKWHLRLDEDLGACNFSAGNYTAAINNYDSAQWQAAQFDDKQKMAEILIRLGSVYRRRGGEGWYFARNIYEQALKLVKELGDPLMEAVCERKIGSTYLFQGRPDMALEHIETSLKLCKESKHAAGIYKGLQHKGWAYAMLGRWEEATKLRKLALELVEQATKDNWELAKAYWYLGDSYRLERKREEARLAYEKALENFEQYDGTEDGVKLILGMVWLGLGKVFIKLPGKELEAKNLLNKSLEVYRDLKEEFKVAEILTEQGDLLLKIGQYAAAEERLVIARKSLMRLGNNYHYANNLLSLGDLYYRRERFDQIYPLVDELQRLENPELLNYALSKLELLAGKAQCAKKEFLAGFQAFYRASSSALKFNQETFREVRNDILSFSGELPIHIIKRFFDEYTNYLKLLIEHAVDKNLELLHESIERVKQKENEMASLSTIP